MKTGLLLVGALLAVVSLSACDDPQIAAVKADRLASDQLRQDCWARDGYLDQGNGVSDLVCRASDNTVIANYSKVTS